MTILRIAPAALAAALAACAPDARAVPAAAVPGAASDGPGSAIAGAPGGESALADLAFDGAGRLHALFVAGGGASPSLVSLTHDDEGAGWGAARAVASGLGRVGLARLAVDGDRVNAFWYAAPPPADAGAPLTELSHARLGEDGWSVPRRVYFELRTGGIPDPALAPAVAPDGVLRVVHAASGRGLAAASPQGAGWSHTAFADRDGHSAAWARTPDGAGGELAYVGTEVALGERGNSDVFVRALDARGWGPAVRVHADPRGYSHFPVLLRDGRGERHLFWLEDTGGDVIPEALFHARSQDGRRWSAAEDVTPPALAGGIVWMVGGAVDEGGGLHLLFRASRADRTGNAVHHLRPGADGRDAAPALLVPADRMGTGDALLARDPVRGGLAAAWRAADGGYRWARLPASR